MTTDHQDLRLLHPKHLPRPSTPLRLRLRLRLRFRLELRQIPRILLPHCPPHHRLRRRNLRHDLDSQRRRSLLRRMPADCRHLQRSQLAAFLGDNASTVASQQESGFDRDRELC